MPKRYNWDKKTVARANYAVAKAKKNGLLSKLNGEPLQTSVCVDCGAEATEYDHRDYNKPLDVVPVCSSCNKLRGSAIPTQQAAKLCPHCFPDEPR